jgi:hypothetical protein
VAIWNSEQWRQTDPQSYSYYRYTRNGVIHQAETHITYTEKLLTEVLNATLAQLRDLLASAAGRQSVRVVPPSSPDPPIAQVARAELSVPLASSGEYDHWRRRQIDQIKLQLLGRQI